MWVLKQTWDLEGQLYSGLDLRSCLRCIPLRATCWCGDFSTSRCWMRTRWSWITSWPWRSLCRGLQAWLGHGQPPCLSADLPGSTRFIIYLDSWSTSVDFFLHWPYQEASWRGTPRRAGLGLELAMTSRRSKPAPIPSWTSGLSNFPVR